MHLRTSAQGRLRGSQVCSQWVSSTSWRVHFLFSEPARFQDSGGKAGPRRISGLQPNRLGVKAKRQPWAEARVWGRKTRVGLALPETRPMQQGRGSQTRVWGTGRTSLHPPSPSNPLPTPAPASLLSSSSHFPCLFLWLSHPVSEL